MFGKKKAATTESKGQMPNVRIATIPEPFYGGKDPVLYHEAKPVKKAPPKPAPQPEMKKPTTAPPPAALSKRRNPLVIIIPAVVLLLGIAGGVWYFVFRQPKPVVRVVTPPPPPPAPAPAPVREPVEIIPPEPIPPTTTPQIEERPLTFPSVLLTDSIDTDLDTLTDIEEEIFQTDTGIWDSDSDGYYDGQEVLNLYNPQGFAPVRLIDSGLVREYASSVFGYRVYYPSTWEMAGVGDGDTHMLFSSITGDFIELRAFPKTAGESFDVWFARTVEGQDFSEIVQFVNRFNVDGLRRRDNLVAYFPTETNVFVLVYSPKEAAAEIPFRHVFQMMYQSFRPQYAESSLPFQPILPGVEENQENIFTGPAFDSSATVF